MDRRSSRLTREPGGIESEALQVEQVGGVVACIHREGEQPGEDEALWRRAPTSSASAAARETGRRAAPFQLAREVTRPGTAPCSRRRRATLRPRPPFRGHQHWPQWRAPRSATMKSPESASGSDGRLRRCGLDHGAADADRQHPSRPGSGDGIRCDHGDRHAVGRLARFDAGMLALGQEVADPCSSWRPAGAPPFRRNPVAEVDGERTSPGRCASTRGGRASASL